MQKEPERKIVVWVHSLSLSLTIPVNEWGEDVNWAFTTNDDDERQPSFWFMSGGHKFAKTLTGSWPRDRQCLLTIACSFSRQEDCHFAIFLGLGSSLVSCFMAVTPVYGKTSLSLSVLGKPNISCRRQLAMGRG